MRVTYMTRVNHTLAPSATIILHAYNMPQIARKPSQTLAFAPSPGRVKCFDMSRMGLTNIRSRDQIAGSPAASPAGQDGGDRHGLCRLVLAGPFNRQLQLRLRVSLSVQYAADPWRLPGDDRGQDRQGAFRRRRSERPGVLR